MKFINRRGWYYTVGLNIFKPYLLKAKREETHDDYVSFDVNYLPVKEEVLDVVITIELLEHLTREDGVKLKSLHNVLKAVNSINGRNLRLIFSKLNTIFGSSFCDLLEGSVIFRSIL